MRSARQLQAEAWRAVVQALGPADALRYRILFEPGEGDYAAEREALFGDLTTDDWIDLVKRRRESDGS